MLFLGKEKKPDASSFLLGLVNDFLVEYHVVIYIVIYKRTLQAYLRTLVIACHILTILYVTETQIIVPKTISFNC